MLAAQPQYMNHGRLHYVFTPRTLTRILAVFPDMPRLLTLFHFNCRYFSLYLQIFTGSSVSSAQTRYNAFRVIWVIKAISLAAFIWFPATFFVRRGQETIFKPTNVSFSRGNYGGVLGCAIISTNYSATEAGLRKTTNVRWASPLFGHAAFDRALFCHLNHPPQPLFSPWSRVVLWACLNSRQTKNYLQPNYHSCLHHHLNCHPRSRPPPQNCPYLLSHNLLHLIFYS